MIRGLIASIAAFSAFAVTYSDAWAGTYDMHVCASSVSKQVYGTEGWTALNPDDRFFYDLSCDDGQFGVNSTSALPSMPAGFRTGWQFRLPKPLTVTEIDLDYQTSVPLWTPWSGQVWGQRHDSPQWLDVVSCDGEFCSNTNHAIPVYGMGAIAFGVHCNGSACPAGAYARATMRELTLRIEDPLPPIVNATSGSLLSAGDLAGVAALTFHAVDHESGVRSAELEVDGKVVDSTQFDTPTHSCHDPFIRFDPCPGEADESLAVDTTTLPDGPHTARLLVRDASNNVAQAGEWPFSTANRTVMSLCSAQIGDGARIRLHPSVPRYGHGVSLEFQWRAIPWGSADVVVFSGSERLADIARAVPKAHARYAADIPPGPNRTVRVAVRPGGSTGSYACSRARDLKVRAGLRLMARPRHLSNGHAVHLRGRLLGAGARGRTIVIEARARGGRRAWTPVHVLRTGTKGAFKSSYQFGRTFQTTRYLFRARFPRQQRFPYAPGASRRVGVVVEP